MAQQWVDVLTATGGIGFYDNQTGSPVTLPYTRSVPFGQNYHGIGILMTTVAAALPANSTILAIRAQGTVVADGAVSGTARMGNGMLPGGSAATTALQGTTPVTVVMPETNVAAGATPDTAGHTLTVTDASTTRNFTFNLTQLDVLVEVPDPDPDPDPDPPKGSYYVYEMEKGWSFDGAYIPHFLELNWLFQEDPFTYTSVQKVRVHGLAKGKAQLHVSMAGMQPDPIADYTSDYSEPQWLDLPYTPMHVSSDFVPVTHYVDYSDRGLALQMKFEGRNKDLTKPEPAHVLQVLALQGTPRGNGARSN